MTTIALAQLEIEPGAVDDNRDRAVADVAGFRVGVTTCYDLRFPELYRRLVEKGATLVLVPSAWPYPRIEHWETLSRARAIENQSFLATINGSGAFDDATLLGRSTVYDPWGVPIASSGDDPALVLADLDLTAVADVREEFPALRDRRLWVGRHRREPPRPADFLSRGPNSQLPVPGAFHVGPGKQRLRPAPVP